ncbi:isoprenylcysteine carboxylmethyltransferase family protein [Gangjinia marincola]|uniref:methyltransferase family protein n=1 Tax=Gangjinia marincola TaxID=578463 RepID=UPI0031DE66D1
MMSKNFGLVFIQIILFGLYFLPIRFWSFILPDYLQIVNLIIIGMGILVVILGAVQLNKNLTPFPSPKPNNSLVYTGVYSMIRHPMYTGILFIFLGYALYRHSCYKIIVWVAFYVLFRFKSNYEEMLLLKKHSDYKQYREKTGRFLPNFILFLRNKTE